MDHESASRCSCGPGHCRNDVVRDQPDGWLWKCVGRDPTWSLLDRLEHRDPRNLRSRDSSICGSALWRVSDGTRLHSIAPMVTRNAPELAGVSLLFDSTGGFDLRRRNVFRTRRLRAAFAGSGPSETDASGCFGWSNCSAGSGIRQLEVSLLW